MRMAVVLLFLLVTGALVLSFMATAPPYVLVGPVHIGSGLPGVIGTGSSRKQVIGLLGEPARQREDAKSVTPQDYSNVDPVSSDYFVGVYADVWWDNRDKASMLMFDMDKFARDYRSELRVVLQYGQRQAVLDRKLSMDEVRRVLHESLGIRQARILVKERDLYIMGSASPSAALHFRGKDRHLSTIDILL